MFKKVGLVAFAFAAALLWGFLSIADGIDARPLDDGEGDSVIAVERFSVPHGDGAALDALYGALDPALFEQCRNVGKFNVFGLGTPGHCQSWPSNRRLLLGDPLLELNCPGGNYRLAALAYTCQGTPVPWALLRFTGTFTATISVSNGLGMTACGLHANPTDRLYVQVEVPPGQPMPDHVRVYATCCQCCEEGTRRAAEPLFEGACPSSRVVFATPDPDVPRRLPCFDAPGAMMGARIRVATCGTPRNPYMGHVTALNAFGLAIGSYPIVDGEAVIGCMPPLEDGSRPGLVPHQWRIEVGEGLTVREAVVEYYCCDCPLP